MIRLYLDVDGVLLRSNQEGEYRLIYNARKFLKYTRKNFDCFWLSTHSRYCAEDVKKYLAPFFKKAGIDITLIAHIKAVTWKTLKTEALDLSSPFIWVDDAPLLLEFEALRKKNLEKYILIVNKEQNLLKQLKRRVKLI